MINCPQVFGQTVDCHLDKKLVMCYSKLTSFLRGKIIGKGGIDTKHKDPYVGTRRAWDRRCLITVSTHILKEDKEALQKYCRKHGTSPYHLLRAYLMDCVSLARLEAETPATVTPIVSHGSRASQVTS